MPTIKEQSAAHAASMARVLMPQMNRILQRDTMPNEVITFLEAALEMSWSKGYTQGTIEALDHVTEGLQSINGGNPSGRST